MRAAMPFQVDIGWHSDRGTRDRNEDFVAALAAPEWESDRGLIAAIADGVSAGGHGRAAAQTAVISLVEDFHGVPRTWETSVALDRLIGAHNAWLADHNRRRSDQASGLTTLTAVVLAGHRWTVAHVGDTRAWLWRAGQLALLTHDHVIDHPDLRSGLTRALGLEDTVRIDYHEGQLQIGDRLLLTTDGVHGSLGARQIAALLGGAGDANTRARGLVAAALTAGSRDNASAIVLDVLGLATAALEDALLLARELPPLLPLGVGDTVDGYTIGARIADTGVHRLYRARDAASGEEVAIKALHESRVSDVEERTMLAHEAWLGIAMTQRGSEGFVRVRMPREPSAFYVVFDWHGGSTLEQMLAEGRRFGIDDIVRGGIAVAHAIGALHRQRIVHRDIKPANLHLGDDGRWRVLDLGAAISGRESVAHRTLRAGTPSYMNPEQWAEGGEADARSDLFALGVTLYRWLTARLPYGEIEPYQVARYRRDPTRPSRLNPEVPVWLDHVVRKAIAREAKARFETAEEFALALERGAARPLAPPRPTPLIARDPAALWKIGFLVMALVNALLVYWLLFLPR